MLRTFHSHITKVTRLESNGGFDECLFISQILEKRSEVLPIRRLFVALLALCALQGCEVVFPPSELKEIGKFDSSSPPDPGNHMNRLVEQLNHSSMDMAKASGQSTALQLVERESGKNDASPLWPTAPDLALRAFFSRESLAASSVTGAIRYERSAIPEALLDSIDFSKQFVVVLSRPKEVPSLPSTSDIFRNDSTAYYIDSLQREHTFGDSIILRLRSKVIGQPPMLPREWSSTLFVIDREQAASLKFRLGEKEYVYSLHGDLPSVH